MTDVIITAELAPDTIVISRLNDGKRFSITSTDNNGDIDLTRDQAHWVSKILQKMLRDEI